MNEPERRIPGFLTRKDQRTMNKMVEEIEGTVSALPVAYAPASQRGLEPEANRVRTFGELPTKEIDDAIAVAEGKLEQLKRDAQAVRDVYIKHTDRIIDEVKRLEEAVQKGMETMRTMKAQCEELGWPQKSEKE